MQKLKEGTVDDMLTELKEQMHIKFREYCKNITLKMKSLDRVCDLQLQQDCKVKDVHDLVNLTMNLNMWEGAMMGFGRKKIDTHAPLSIVFVHHSLENGEEAEGAEDLGGPN